MLLFTSFNGHFEKPKVTFALYQRKPKNNSEVAVSHHSSALKLLSIAFFSYAGMARIYGNGPQVENVGPSFSSFILVW